MNAARYVASLGFHNVTEVKMSKPEKYKGFRFTSFDASVVHRYLGKSKAHRVGCFVFLLSKERGIYVNVKKRIVVLGNGTSAVQCLFNTVNKVV